MFRQALLSFAPAAEDQAAQGKAKAERAHGERTDRDRLAPGGKALPAADRLLFLGGQRLAAALLADRATGSEPEIQIVEDFGGFVGHVFSV